jgi:uncharacterized phage protein (TIGR02218 family)
MPAIGYEVSGFGGRPIELFEFIRNSGGTDYIWRYNGSDRNVWYNDVEWKAVPIRHEAIRLSSEAQSTTLVVTMPIEEEFCQQLRYFGTLPSDTVWLRLRRAHVGDITDIDSMTPTVSDALITWIGTVNGILQVDEVEAKITCAMLAASFQRGGLRYGYQRNCPHVLYATNTCKVDRELFRVFATVTAIGGLTITASGFPVDSDGWFDGGFMEYHLPSGMLERRMIITHAGDQITLIGTPAGLDIGDPISVFPGCDRVVDTCVNKFNNLGNFGGFPHTPGRNPFDGQPVF